ncbi:MAG: hypothetical protein ACTHK0_03055 [Ginsengibacter sp.]
MIFLILLISPIVLHAQVFVNVGVGAATFDQQIEVGEGLHTLPTQVIVPVVKMAAGYDIKNLMLEAELRPTLTRKRNSSNDLGIKAGYRFNHFIPAIGYYYNYCNSDNPINNTSGIGYSLEYDVPVTQNGDLYIEGAYLNNSYQLTAGFHIPL